MKPTIGRVVHVIDNNGEECAGIVIAVCDDDIKAIYWTQQGAQNVSQWVEPLPADEDDRIDDLYWTWPKK